MSAYRLAERIADEFDAFDEPMEDMRSGGFVVGIRFGDKLYEVLVREAGA